MIRVASPPHQPSSAHEPQENMSQNQFDKKSQAWSALFSEPMSDLVKRYTSSVFFDKRLWQADIAGSLAHADMLCAQGIINAADHASIQSGMATRQQYRCDTVLSCSIAPDYNTASIKIRSFVRG